MMEPRRAAVAAVPVVVPASMAALFTLLGRHLPARTAYNAGFAVYWIVWCFGFPLAVLGRRRTAALLTSGRRPGTAESALLVLPLAGAVGSALVPNRRQVEPTVAVVMAGTAVVNAVGEELLWRGLFLEEFPDARWAGLVWPWLGFTLWHVAPQTILPSAQGRWRFVAGAGLVGLASAVVARRTRGLRYVVVPHVLTDACGVTAARFRLGR